MNQHILAPCLFPPISYMSMWVSESCAWNVSTKYEKRTWRNRYRILGPNGPQDISAPISHSSNKSVFSEVELDHRHDWVSKEWKSIETAYRNAAFFEALAPELETLITTPHKTLLERCSAAMFWVCSQLQISSEIDFATERADELPHLSPSKEVSGIPYRQVFNSKHGFVAGLSILDLLMNEGPLAYDILREQYGQVF